MLGGVQPDDLVAAGRDGLGLTGERGRVVAAALGLTGAPGRGARVERINWMGDRSPKGIKDSAAMMVNYLYDLADIEANHEAYTAHGQIAASPAVLALLRPERIGI